jgi:hypothetical protein
MQSFPGRKCGRLCMPVALMPQSKPEALQADRGWDYPLRTIVTTESRPGTPGWLNVLSAMGCAL